MFAYFLLGSFACASPVKQEPFVQNPHRVIQESFAEVGEDKEEGFKEKDLVAMESLKGHPPECSCTGWSPSHGNWKGTGHSCAYWGWTIPWCYVNSTYAGPGFEFIKTSEVYSGKLYAPCKGTATSGVCKGSTTPTPDCPECDNTNKMKEDQASEIQKCHAAGEEVVAAAQAERDQAKKAAEAKAAALTAAKDAPISVGSYKWQSLNPNECQNLFDKDWYKMATTAVNEAQEAHSLAQGALEEANKAVETADEASKKMIATCVCNVKELLAAALGLTAQC